MSAIKEVSPIQISPGELRNYVDEMLRKVEENQLVVARALYLYSSNRAGSWQELIGYEIKVRARGVREDWKRALYNVATQGHQGFLRSSRAI